MSIYLWEFITFTHFSSECSIKPSAVFIPTQNPNSTTSSCYFHKNRAQSSIINSSHTWKFICFSIFSFLFHSTLNHRRPSLCALCCPLTRRIFWIFLYDFLTFVIFSREKTLFCCSSRFASLLPELTNRFSSWEKSQHVRIKIMFSFVTWI